jgi:hypothetical protein
VPTRDTLGGIVHTYQRYDPARIPPPRPPEIDLVTPAMEHLLEFGDSSELTEEQLADFEAAFPAAIADARGVAELLPAEVAARKREDLEALRLVLVVDLLKARVLAGEAALAGDIWGYHAAA